MIIDASRIKKTMKAYFIAKNINYTDFEIHDINIELSDKDRGSAEIKIKLGRPGIFIGRGGKDVNDLQKFLEDTYLMDIKFALEDFDPFNNQALL